MQKKVKCITCNKIQKVEDLFPGNVINFPQDVQEVANILPFSVNDLRNNITIRLDNSDGYKDLNVCRGKVREALQWLKNNNPLYKILKISNQKLNELPENGNVYKSMNGYTKTNADGNVERMQSCFKEQKLEAEHSFDEDEDEPLNDNNLYHSEDSDNEIPTIKYTDVPNIKTYTQKDQINSSLSGSVYLWPTIGTTPVNEFSSPGYISLAFPTLFPFGKGDYSMLQGNKIKLSTADFHWPEDYKLLGYNVERLSMKRRSQIIAENPLYFDSYFVLKSRYFVEQCMKEKFDIKNFWYRYEYQHRGSIHLHGVAWLSNCPDTSNVDTDKKKQDIIEYFENIITCNNPDVNVRMSGVHPCQIKLSSVKDHFEDLATLVNTVQRHTVCKTTYCLRKKSPNSKEKCRFSFPRPMTSKTKLVMDGTLVKDIIFKRNDPLLNKYNSWMLETWRANIDVTPDVNTDSIIRGGSVACLYGSKRLDEENDSKIQSGDEWMVHLGHLE
ncbi:hypothetical protein FOCC_FOCC009660 [Frankliniella occidentalis]|nr:hypothetical protein FOCC_FOCC009660 [Frankliniella occidentalis]